MQTENYLHNQIKRNDSIYHIIIIIDAINNMPFDGAKKKSILAENVS